MESSFSRPRKLTVYRERSQSVARLMSQLAKAMSEFTPVVRDAEGTVVRHGKPVTYRYSSLDSINRSTKQFLLKHGVVPSQEYCVSDEGVTLITTLSFGDEFLSSTLPIKQFDDSQRLKAHMSYMRRTALEALLCLSAEDDADGADAVEKSEEAPSNATWAAQERLARDAIAAAKTPAAVESILAKIAKKIEGGDMNPNCIGSMEDAAANRMDELNAQEVTA
jgi:hypothetical protein